MSVVLANTIDEDMEAITPNSGDESIVQATW